MQTSPIRIDIVGATGYVGMELCRLLVRHEGFTLTTLCSNQYAGQRFDDLYPLFRNRLETVLSPLDVDQLAETCDVVITALPHGVSGEWVPKLLDAGLTVLDHSGDFRFRDRSRYEAAYKLTHPAPALLETAVYGLPEYHRDALRTANLIANPGCYPTCTLMALLPGAKGGWFEPGAPIIVDAASGTSGAGRKADATYGVSEMGQNYKPYGVVGHRHTPEMVEHLERGTGQTGWSLTFTPHLLPIGRGMLATIYAKPSDTGRALAQSGQLTQAMADAYTGEPFVRVLPSGQLPQIAAVIGSNFCDIAAAYDPDTDLIKLFSAIDNLGKGACAQAIQALNIRFGFPETLGLEHLGQGI